MSSSLKSCPFTKTIYFNYFNILVMLLPIEPQKEPDFPMAQFQIAKGTQSAVFPTQWSPHWVPTRWYCWRSLGKIEHSFEVDEYGKNSTHVKHIYDIKEHKIGSFFYVVTSKNLAYNNQKVARIFIYLNIINISCTISLNPYNSPLQADTIPSLFCKWVYWY